MRGLQFSDVFRFSEILDKTGVEFDLNALLDKAKAVTDEESGDITAKIGGQIGLLILKKVHKAEKEVYKFIANLEEKTVEDIQKYSIKDLHRFFEELVKQEDFADFFPKAEAVDEN